MTNAERQLVLDLPHRPALGYEDFIVSGSNEAAVGLVDAWPGWPHLVLVLAGPAGSGKTHLANVWRQQSGAALVPASGLDEAALSGLGDAKALAVEDADRGLGSERALFHLMNLTREQGLNLLITGRTPPGEWPVALPDLRSRLRACPVTTLGEPDEALLLAVLVKLLSDRQLPATPAAVSYLARHMDRSMVAAIAVVEALDRLLWARPSEITREVARRALAETGKETSGEERR
jgi:chromosomal replication initiation ATPase DnaA